MGIGQGTTAGHDPSTVCSPLLDAVGNRGRAGTCGLEPEVPVPVGFHRGSSGAQTGTSAARIENVLPFEKPEPCNEDGCGAGEAYPDKEKTPHEG